MSNSNYYAVIMAGGVGSRFWPVSTQAYPKQFHDMLGTGQSLIQRTFERINMLIPKENVLIATNEQYENLVAEQLPELDSNQILVEPTMRNTAPCILYAALKLYQKNPEAVLLVAPSDHWIKNEFEFLRTVKIAFEKCSSEDVLMTLGIQPDFPNTGYGYIKYQNSDAIVKNVINFTEKPNRAKAEGFLEDGNYLWNAGIFVWSAKAIIEAFKVHLPEMFSVLNAISYNTDFEKGFIQDNYKKCENISIDYGILERATNVRVLPVDFGWSDLGTWGALYHKLEKDTNENTVVGAEVIFRDSKNNILSTQNGKRVVVQGLDNFIIVEREDVLLICPKDQEQDIKDIRDEVLHKFGNKFI